MNSRVLFSVLLLLTCRVVAVAQEEIVNYIPNPVQVPALEAKGAGSIRAGFSWANAYGYNLMGIYSPLKYVAVMVNHNGRKMRDSREFHPYNTDFSLTEVGAGGYYTKRKQSVSVMAGYGKEKVFSTFSRLYSRTSTLWMQRYFLQGSYAHTGKMAMIGVGFRVIMLQYDKGLISRDIDSDYLAAYQNIERKTPIVYHELAFQAGIIQFYPVSLTVHVTTFLPKLEGFRFQQNSIGMCLGYSFGRKKAPPVLISNK